MASVYVAGLEMRSSGAAPPVWALGAYRLVLDTASRLHADVIPPEPSAGQPSDFFEATATHIESAQAGVTLLSAADPSAAVEAAMLAYSGKPQLIIAEDEADVPRLVRTLPLVSQVVALNGRPDLPGILRKFLEANLRGGRVVTG